MPYIVLPRRLVHSLIAAGISQVQAADGDLILFRRRLSWSRD
jgi:hypothetical protein